MTLSVINQCCPELLSVCFLQLHLLHAEHSFCEEGEGLYSKKVVSHREKHVTRDLEDNRHQVRETVSSYELSPSWTRPRSKFYHLCMQGSEVFLLMLSMVYYKLVHLAALALTLTVGLS